MLGRAHQLCLLLLLQYPRKYAGQSQSSIVSFGFIVISLHSSQFFKLGIPGETFLSSHSKFRTKPMMTFLVFEKQQVHPLQISGSHDETLKVWNVKNGACIRVSFMTLSINICMQGISIYVCSLPLLCLESLLGTLIAAERREEEHAFKSYK